MDKTIDSDNHIVLFKNHTSDMKRQLLNYLFVLTQPFFHFFYLSFQNVV